MAEEWLAPMDRSQCGLVKAIDVPPRRIKVIVKGQCALLADTAVPLAFFVTDLQNWTNLQAH